MNSWIIIERATGAAILETYNPKAVACLNAAKYEAVPILAYLEGLNARIKAAGGLDPWENEIPVKEPFNDPAPDFALSSHELRARSDRELADRINREAIRQPSATVEFVPSGKPRATVSFGWGR